MTPDTFRAHLARRNFGQVEFAEVVRVDGRTVRRWADPKRDPEKHPIPYAVQMLLEGRRLGRGKSGS